MRDLIERLEKATGPEPDIDGAIAIAFDFPGVHQDYDTEHTGKYWYYGEPGIWENVPRFTASIDAAVALAERVLPDAGWAVAMNRTDRRYVGRIWSGEIDDGKANAGATPAIALCIAILRAAEESAG